MSARLNRLARPNLPSRSLRALQVMGLALLTVLGAVAVVLVALRGAPVVWLFDPHGDFSDFYGAAQAAQRGRDLYAVPLYHYLPTLALLLRPLALLAQDRAYDVWVAFLLLCVGGALALLTRQYGRCALAGALALSPALALAVMVSQPVVLVMLALAAVMVALERECLFLAGVLLAAAWLKPQDALPAACLFALCRPRVAMGFGLGSVALLASPRLPAWLHSMSSFAVEREKVQASLAGVWPSVFGPHHPGFLVILTAALAGSVLAQRRSHSHGHARTLALLLLIWFCAAPYSHAYDATMLLVPLAVLGPFPSALLVDGWLATALSFYSLSTVVIVAPLLLIGALVKRPWPRFLARARGRAARRHRPA